MRILARARSRPPSGPPSGAGRGRRGPRPGRWRLLFCARFAGTMRCCPILRSNTRSRAQKARFGCAVLESRPLFAGPA